MRILILCFMAVASLSFSIGKEIGESENKEPEIVFLSNPNLPNLDVIEEAVELQTTTTTILEVDEDIPFPKPEYREKVIVTTTTLPEGTCSEWYSVAVEAGWSVDQLQKLGRIIWRESNCRHDVANKTYSYGLTQIEWSAHYKWLDSEFGITEREALYDPYTNLLVAKWLYDYAEEAYGCGWQPWYMSGDWC